MIKVGHDLTDLEIVARYDAFRSKLAMRSYFYYPAVAEFIGDVNGQHVLDAGCGSGHLLAELRRRNPRATSWPAAALAPRIRPMRGFLPHEHPLRTEQPIDTVFSQREVFDLFERAGLRVTRRTCRETFPYLLEILYKFGRLPNPPRIWAMLDRATSWLGWTVLGYRVFVRCRPA